MNYHQALVSHINTLPPALRLRALTSPVMESCISQIRSGQRAEEAYNEAMAEIEAERRVNQGRRGF